MLDTIVCIQFMSFRDRLRVNADLRKMCATIATCPSIPSYKPPFSILEVEVKSFQGSKDWCIMICTYHATPFYNIISCWFKTE